VLHTGDVDVHRIFYQKSGVRAVGILPLSHVHVYVLIQCSYTSVTRTL